MTTATRCQKLSAPIIESAGDITFNTPDGNTITDTFPILPTHMSNRLYVDAKSAGLMLAPPVVAKTVTGLTTPVYNGIAQTITTPTNNIDGVLLAISQRILVTEDNTLNGSYVVTALAPTVLTRSSDVLSINFAVYVARTPGEIWYQSSPDVYTQFTGGSSVVVAGAVTINPTMTVAEINAIIANPAVFTATFGGGTYTLTNSIRANRNNLILNGVGATLIMANSIHEPVIQIGDPAITPVPITNITITGFTIDSNTPTQTTSATYPHITNNGIDIRGVSDAYIREVRIRQCVSGIGMSALCARVSVHTCTCSDNITGITIRDSMSCQVSNCDTYNNTTGIDIDDNTHACTLDACCAYANTTGIRLAKCNDITSDCRTYTNTNGVLFENSTINAVAPIYPTNCFIGGRATSNQIGINVLSVASHNVFGGTSTNNTLLNVTAGITRTGTLPGSVTSLASATIPDGWLLCDGTSLIRADYIDLFAAIGTQFGAIDIDHFNIPDLRDRFIRGDDPGDARGFGTLQLDDIKSHDHPVTDAGLLKLATANPSINTYTSGSSIIGFESALYATPSTGGTETRPVNVNLSAIIKV